MRIVLNYVFALRGKAILSLELKPFDMHCNLKKFHGCMFIDDDIAKKNIAFHGKLF